MEDTCDDKYLGVISPTGRHYAHITPDGKLRIWETSTQILKHEYIPSSHLSARCTALSWAPHVKGKKTTHLAVGTETGAAFLFSLELGNLQATFPQEHCARVTGFAWDLNHHKLYSSSLDKYVIEWSLDDYTLVNKWKAAKSSGGTTSLCLIPRDDYPYLLTAHGSIKLWDLKAKTTLKKFDGHGTAIFKMEATRDATFNYFFSSALEERQISCWNLSLEQSVPSASFGLEDEPLAFALHHFPEEKQVILGAVLKSGGLNIFQRKAKFNSSKPYPPSYIIKLADSDEFNRARPLPILACHINPDASILIAYGNYLNPIFEKITLGTDSKIFLLRHIEKAKVNVEKNAQNLYTLDHSLKFNVADSKHKHDLKTTFKNKPLYEESLDNQHLTIDAKEALNLMKALQRSDDTIISPILSYNEEKQVSLIVSHLDKSCILPLFIYMRDNFNQKRSYHIWVEAVLKKFTDYLLDPSVDQAIYDLLDDLKTLIEDVPYTGELVYTLPGEDNDIIEGEDEDEPIHLVEEESDYEGIYEFEIDFNPKMKIADEVNSLDSGVDESIDFGFETREECSDHSEEENEPTTKTNDVLEYRENDHMNLKIKSKEESNDGHSKEKIQSAPKRKKLKHSRED